MMPCKKKDEVLNGKDFAIKIKEYKIQQGGLFTPSHINYVICTLPLGWEVQRRFSDFNWLKRTLLKQYPQYIVIFIIEHHFSMFFLKSYLLYLQKNQTKNMIS